MSQLVSPLPDAVVPQVAGVDLVVLPRGHRMSAPAWKALLHDLPPAEQRRLRSYRYDNQQDSAVGWHLLVRLAAQHHVSVWRNPDGRPVADPPLDVSLSHAGGWVAAVAYRHGRVGVDLEATRRVDGALARRCLSAAELAWLDSASDGSSRQQRFLRLWTAKEAYLKAIGTGLGVDPRSITIDCTAPVPRLVGPDGSRWRFHSATPAENLRLSLCLERLP